MRALDRTYTFREWVLSEDRPAALRWPALLLFLACGLALLPIRRLMR